MQLQHSHLQRFNLILLRRKQHELEKLLSSPTISTPSPTYITNEKSLNKLHYFWESSTQFLVTNFALIVVVPSGEVAGCDVE